MPEVKQLRGGYVEAVHPFSVAAATNDGRAEWVGPHVASPWRSAGKPFQLEQSLDLLQGERFSPQELAVGAASHAAEPTHLALVEGLLGRFGLTVEQLRCGAHLPLSQAATEMLLRRGGEASALHNNCSGKHSFMLAASRRQGWDLDYRPSEHPLQRRILARVSELAGEVPGLATDGCGVPTFHLTLRGMASAWAHLARAVVQGGEGPLGQIGQAMLTHPELMSGSQRLDRAVMAAAREPLLVKIGAAGVYCMALPQRRLGLAVKIHSGAEGALPAALEYALQHFAPGAWQRPDPWPWCEVTNVAGRVVGGWEVA